MAKTKLYDAPLFSVPLSKELLLLVTVCGALSLFVHVTLSPAFTVIVVGLNAKLLIETLVSVETGEDEFGVAPASCEEGSVCVGVGEGVAGALFCVLTYQ